MYLDYSRIGTTWFYEVFDAITGISVFPRVPTRWLAHLLCVLITADHRR